MTMFGTIFDVNCSIGEFWEMFDEKDPVDI